MALVPRTSSWRVYLSPTIFTCRRQGDNLPFRTLLMVDPYIYNLTIIGTNRNKCGQQLWINQLENNYKRLKCKISLVHKKLVIIFIINVVQKALVIKLKISSTGWSIEACHEKTDLNTVYIRFESIRCIWMVSLFDLHPIAKTCGSIALAEESKHH